MQGINKYRFHVVAAVVASDTRETGLEGSPIDQTSGGAYTLRNERIRAPTVAESPHPRVIAPTGLSTVVSEPVFRPP